MPPARTAANFRLRVSRMAMIVETLPSIDSRILMVGTVGSIRAANNSASGISPAWTITGSAFGQVMLDR